MHETSKNSEYLECGLPEYLLVSLEKFKEGEYKHKTDPDYLHFDCDFCEFQSDINIAETGGEITERQAWYLRNKYLGITNTI